MPEFLPTASHNIVEQVLVLVLVLVDSDTCFVCDVNQSTLVPDGATQLFRRKDGIRPDMKMHVVRHQNS